MPEPTTAQQEDFSHNHMASDLAGKKLLLLGGSDPHRKVVDAAHELGVYVIVADYYDTPDSPAKRIADEPWLADVFDIDLLERRCRESGVDGVLNFCSDAAQMPYQQLCERLGLPCYGNRFQFEVLSEKRPFKKYCAEHGLLVIPSYTADEVRAGKAPYPLFVKPSASRGSRGQTVCYDINDFERGLVIAERESQDGVALIEKYMEGYQDFGISYFIIDGEPYPIKLTDRCVGKPEEGTNHQQIGSLSPGTNVAAFMEKTDPRIRRFLKDLGLRYGSLFIQGYLLDDGEVYCYDPGLRLPGSDFDVMVSNVTGFNSMKSAINFALTGDVKSRFGDPRGAWKLGDGVGMIFSIVARAGTITAMEGLDEVLADPRFQALSRRHEVGDRIENTGDTTQRVAEFIAWVPERDEVADLLDFVYSRVRVLDEHGENMMISIMSYENGKLVVR